MVSPFARILDQAQVGQGVGKLKYVLGTLRIGIDQPARDDPVAGK